jgi:hypothetical protein
LSLEPGDFGIVLADDDDFGFRQFFADNPGGLESVHARHGNIHQDEARSQGPGLFDAVLPILSLSANVPVRARGQQGA